ITGFLPSYYEFSNVERTKDEHDSGIGKISVHSEGKNNLLLEYPEQVTATMVSQKCENNEFRRHFYRSHLLAKSTGSYIPLLVDTSYSEPDSRILLMMERVSQKRERIVISTIALDWELHKELLTNIIIYL